MTIKSGPHASALSTTASPSPVLQYAMVLAAGLGTRMRPLTDTRPKPLVKVKGKTLLDYALDALQQAGIQTTTVNVHYLAEQIEAHIESRQKQTDKSNTILISDERAKLLDSGGGIKAAIANMQGQAFYILNADSFWLDDDKTNLQAMNEFWDEEKMDFLLLISDKQKAVGFHGKGDFFMDHNNRLTRRGDEQSAPFIYAGAIIAKPALFEQMKQDIFSLNLLFDTAIVQKRLYGLALTGLWLHVGTPQAIVEAEQAIDAFKANAALS